MIKLNISDFFQTSRQAFSDLFFEAKTKNITEDYARSRSPTVVVESDCEVLYSALKYLNVP